MTENLDERIGALQRSRRRWKLAAIASWAGFALLTVVAAVAVFEVRLATERELAAIREAEAARIEAQKAREEKEQAEGNARRMLYFMDVGLAQREWEAAGARR
jgi:hypothetical protein